MLWLIIGLVLLIVGTVGYYRSSSSGNYSGHRDAYLIMSIPGGVIAGISLVCLLAATLQTIWKQAELVCVERQIKVAEEQYENQISTIQLLASKYPLEKELLENLNPALLLRLPEIKSDIVLIKEAELALKYKDNIYNLRYEENRIKQYLDWLNHRWLIPSLASAKYKQ